ncbi:elongation factor P maturation arginine rhamnosyltransferase EarP [Ampullimonas aquatilis]|uniref:elongation factor P maturation arginine rhamnosyltransferase EarP n=1 Tax=Ampullimonas aquatilis TaxID=1341549 RepID=UPI003C73F78E
MRRALRWDIFCTVVDNYGDIGVCWRLARQLVAEQGQQVRLWVDDLAAFNRLCPTLDMTQAAQVQAGVTILRWQRDAPMNVAAADVANVIVEAFACELPPAYLQAMQASMAQHQVNSPDQPAPYIWINLEYLSAEPWVKGCHGLPSPVSQSGGAVLPPKYFFFPGFATGTGGLLREAELLMRRDAFLQNPAHRQQLTARLYLQLGAAAPQADAIKVLLFSYPNPHLVELLQAWIDSPQPVHVWVPEGPVLEAIRQYFDSAPRTKAFAQGNLTLVRMPFLPQPDFDTLLWACDLLMVRGEDSFVRAQWAARPLVWHIYPQEAAIHHDKLAAWLTAYRQQLDAPAAQVLHDLHARWNALPAEAQDASHTSPSSVFANAPSFAESWPRLLKQLPNLTQHAIVWANHLTQLGDLADNLAKFVQGKLE